MKKSLLTHIWGILTGFGIMFAVLSWCQESELLSFARAPKGVVALMTGFILYKIFFKNIEEQ
tara:strand:- start:113 stop:298 length:186 start_codon:yes stop_codon:yes gene_type:complete